MDVIVTGTVRASNGRSVRWTCDFTGNLNISGTQREIRCTIIADKVFVTFEEAPWLRDVSHEEFFILARHIAYNAILGKVVTDGVGFDLTLEHIRMPDGDILEAPIYGVTGDGTTEIDSETVTRVLGRYPYLRYAFEDFNHGLRDLESCPFFFYRAIETAAKYVLEDIESDVDWPRFHELLGTSRSDMETIEKFSKPHRHGDRANFGGREYRKMTREANHFMLNVIRYIRNREEASGPAD